MMTYKQIEHLVSMMMTYKQIEHLVSMMMKVQERQEEVEEDEAKHAEIQVELVNVESKLANRKELESSQQNLLI